jgi:hypothetical protein
MFVGKDEPSLEWGDSLGQALTMLANMRLGWKGLPESNALDYLKKTFVNNGRKKY